MRPRIFAYCAAVLAAVLSFPALAASLPPQQTLDFAVLREGDFIGTHVMKFNRNGDNINIDIVTDVAVKLAFITVYRFEHEGTETWSNGNFVGTSTITNDDGTDHVLKVHAEGGQLVVNGDGKIHNTPAGIMPASLWHPDIVKRPVLLNTLDGSHMKVTVTDHGMENLTVMGSPAQAHHYAIHGELERELWFDQSGVLVQVRFKGKDGSEIMYVLNKPEPPQAVKP